MNRIIDQPVGINLTSAPNVTMIQTVKDGVILHNEDDKHRTSFKEDYDNFGDLFLF